MLSLDNTYNEADLRDFDARIKNILKELEGKDIDYVIEYKFDGLSLRVSYQDGILKEAVTRGNGEFGDDVTQNAKMISNLPQTILMDGYFEVRGEVMMYTADFKEVNKERLKEGESLFANPRNAAAGSLRLKDPKITKKRKLAFFGYDTPMFEGDSNHIERTKHLEKLGFTTESKHIKCTGIEGVINHIREIGNKKGELPFEIDGLVIKVNETAYWDRLGLTAHHPRWAIAYKFPAETVSTKVLSVEHSVGRTGTITPVANLEPINIGGVVVKRATLHNYEETRNKDVRIGDYVFVRRAGEVIPEVIGPIENQRNGDEIKITPPENCPACAGIVKKAPDKVRFYCDNSLCPIQNKEKMAYAVGKSGFNIDGLGPSIVEKFIEEGLLTGIPSIFKLPEKREQILKLEGFKEKSVDNLISAIESAKDVKVDTLLTALGIPGIGKRTSKEISHLFQSKVSFIEFSISESELEEINDIGPEIAKNIVEFFGKEENIDMLKVLLDNINVEFNSNEIPAMKSVFTGKKVCITGSFENHSRDELAEIIEKAGGKFISSVSKNTDYLLAGEKAGSKKTKAENLGVEIIDINFVLNNINS